MHIELGKMQELMVVKKVDFGVYLAPEDNQEEKVLLPGKQVPEGCETGDFVTVFIYRDSKDRLIATRKEPKLSLGEVAVLTVAQTGKFGAFLDWGLEKDLFLPFKEQTARVQEGDSFPVVLYVDKSGRLCASMKIYHYEISRQFGAFVAVDDRYSALIPPREMFGELRVGELIQARVIAVHEDGKLDLSIRDKSYRIIETDAVKVMELIESFDGVLPFNDKASPEVIKRETQMSKNEFKRAVGHLLKNGRIEITEKSIRKIQ